ncbi:nucleotidyltransferase family protein [Tissierella carlieri]|uniref:nucleotidyltransferase family protein n=1 Tax=Tissierella carlieri TaxID=689904 RepID=UPI001C1019D1|nr:nucleotidyltransferase family protein [Tissierella carlieri]MBU5313761.1 nucleotidyltransferase family protein [Tissierella carlieri]
MKAVILAAGKGKRIDSVTNGENKCLLKIRDKTIIEYNVENISRIDEINEIIIVVGYRSHDIMSKVGNYYNGKRISYCIQKEQKGLINALEAAKYAVEDNDFILILGDEFIINNNYSSAIKRFYEKKYNCMIGIVEVDDINLVKKTYTIEIDENDNILDFIEKPIKPFNNIMGTGNIIFKKSFLKYIDQTPVNSIRGEKELVDFLKIILKKYGNVTTFKVGDSYINLNTKEDYYNLVRLFGVKVDIYRDSKYGVESI